MRKFTFRWLVILSVLLLGIVLMKEAQAAGIDCKKHAIYCQIKKNRSELNTAYAMKLSNIIWKMGRKISA